MLIRMGHYETANSAQKTDGSTRKRGTRSPLCGTLCSGPPTITIGIRVTDCAGSITMGRGGTLLDILPKGSRYPVQNNQPHIPNCQPNAASHAYILVLSTPSFDNATDPHLHANAPLWATTALE